MSIKKSYYTDSALGFQLQYFNNLPEKQRRYFLANEYLKLGRGSQRYLAKAFGCSRQTIVNGIKEISSQNFQPDYSYQRRPGAGPKKKEEVIISLTQWILTYVSKNTAGSPTDEKVKWTHLQPRDISKHIKETYGVNVSNQQVKRILKQNGYCKRKPNKCLATGKSPHREEQFQIILLLTSLFIVMKHNPMISIDTKKKEALGQLTRNEPVLCKDGNSPDVFDHDYSYLASGKAIPHGIYDINLNKGYLTIGNSHETAAFVVDNLAWWWNQYGSKNYPQATTILVFCDCGGANGYRHHLFKKLLLEFAKESGLRILVVHYPPYCSKYNPIERRLFSHVHKTIQGTILTDIQQVKELMSKTYTTKGLTVIVRIVEKNYPIGELSQEKDLDKKRILHHPDLPDFSYTILP